MKKLFLLIALMVLSFGYSQDKDVNSTGTISTKTSNLFGKNELKINALYLILGAAELQYEHILNEESGFGARILFVIDDEIITERPFYFDGFYRFYFGGKPAAGFFVEGFVSYNSLITRNNYFYDQYNNFTYIDDRSNGLGLGLQVGGKFVTRRGLLFEINGGLGRNLIESGSESSRVLGRIGISVGYRF